MAIKAAEIGISELISFQGAATALGGAAGSSIVCATLTTKPDFNGQFVVITGGALFGQTRVINGITTGGVITPDKNFDIQIVQGTQFMILSQEIPLGLLLAWTQDLVDGVYFDSVNGVSGTVFPIGSPGMPSNSPANVLTMLAARKQTKVYIHGTFALSGDIAGANPLEFIGLDKVRSVFDFNTHAAEGCSFQNLEVNGTSTNTTKAYFHGCYVGTLAILTAEFWGCTGTSTMTLLDTGNYTFHNDCQFETAITLAALTAVVFNVLDGKGKLTFTNSTNGGNVITIRGNAMQVVIGGTDTAGTLSVYGDVKLDGKQAAITAGMTVNDYTLQGDVGTVFSIVKTVLQSTIIAAGIDLTLASVGALELIGAYIQNGATAFDSAAHGATAELYTNNISGSVSFMTAAQALLIANCILSKKNATIWTGVILESGKKVSIKATGENFTSAGNADVYLVFRRLAPGATVSAA